MVPVREMMPYTRGSSLSTMEVDDISMEQYRPVQLSDFERVFERVRPTGKLTGLCYYQQVVLSACLVPLLWVDIKSFFCLLCGWLKYRGGSIGVLSEDGKKGRGS